jgi:hypothetical protein
MSFRPRVKHGVTLLDAESGKNISHRFAPIYTDKQEEKWLMVNRKAIN